MANKNLHKEIAQAAYKIYTQRGCIHGHDIDQWLEAEKIVNSNQAVKPKKKDVVKILKTSLGEKTTKTSIKKTETKKTPKPTGEKRIKKL
jgi:hypothetical protein